MRAVFLSSALLICLTGCASTGLVHDKDYVRAAALGSDGRYSVTLAFFGDTEPVSATGDSFEDALEAAQLRTGRQIFTGFTELVLLDGSSPADTLEYMLEEWKISPSCIAAYSSSGGELLRNGDPELLRGSVEEAVRMGRLPDCGAVDVLGRLLSDGEAELAALSLHGTDGNAVIMRDS